MKLPKNNKILTTTMILLLAISAFAAATSVVSAHDPAWNIPTYAYVTASPDTIGQGETTLLVMWLNTIPPTAGGTGGDLWRGFVIDVTAPDGSTSQLGPFTSGPVGTTWTTFTPTQVGTYTMVFSWPGQTLIMGENGNPMGASYVGDFFEGSTSAPLQLVVTQSPTQPWQEPQLPTGYWTRPLNAQNRGWSQLASNWLGGSWLVSNFQMWGTAPNSPHIVWTQPIAEQPGVSSGHPGGLADAQWPSIPYNTDDYQGPWSTPIVMNGVIYYNSPGDAMSPKYGYYAMDLRTGEQLWYNNGTLNNVVITNPSFGAGPSLSESYPRLSFGQLMHYNSVNGQGIVAYLWMTQGSTWYMLDPDNGNLMMTLVNVPGGIGVTDQDGNILRYNYDPSTGLVTAWNSTQAIPFGAPGTSTSAEQWRPRIGAVVDAVNDQSWAEAPLPGGGSNGAWTEADTYHSGYSMNTTLQTGLVWRNAPSYSTNFGTTQILQDDNRVPRMIFSWNNPSSQGDVTGGNGTLRAWAAEINYNAAPRSGPTGALGAQSNWNLEQTVTLLWSKEYPTGPIAEGNLTWINGPVDYDSQVFTVYSKETMQWWGYSLQDGSLLWGPTQPESSWDMYQSRGLIAYDTLFTSGYGGVLHAYDVKTGDLKWNYTATNVGGESPYGNYPLNILAVANGKIFLGSSEHSPTKPLWRGSYLRAVDAGNGHEVYKIETWVDGLAIADGYIVCSNHYSNTIQAFGKGQTATSVLTQDTAAALGSPVLIRGTVTDQSPGAPGTPAISDASMQQWMEYLYMQQSKPSDAVGVPVTLTAIGPDGSSNTIGNVVSDIDGGYALSWTPSSAGVYKIVASFAGSESYFGSSGFTQLLVGSSAAPSVSASPTNAVEPPSSASLPMTYIAIAAAVVIIVVVAAALLMRRRK